MIEAMYFLGNLTNDFIVDIAIIEFDTRSQEVLDYEKETKCFVFWFYLR